MLYLYLFFFFILKILHSLQLCSMPTVVPVLLVFVPQARGTRRRVAALILLLLLLLLLILCISLQAVLLPDHFLRAEPLELVLK